MIGRILSSRLSACEFLGFLLTAALLNACGADNTYMFFMEGQGSSVNSEGMGDGSWEDQWSDDSSSAPLEPSVPPVAVAGASLTSFTCSRASSMTLEEREYLRCSAFDELGRPYPLTDRELSFDFEWARSAESDELGSSSLQTAETETFMLPGAPEVVLFAFPTGTLNQLRGMTFSQKDEDSRETAPITVAVEPPQKSAEEPNRWIDPQKIQKVSSTESSEDDLQSETSSSSHYREEPQTAVREENRERRVVNVVMRKEKKEPPEKEKKKD